MARTTFPILACLLLLIPGCDQSSVRETKDQPDGDTRTEENIPFQIVSGSHLDADAPAARKLRLFLLQSKKISTRDIYWKELKITKMRVDGYASEVSAVVAPIQETDPSHISVSSTGESRKKYPVNYSQLVYLPSIDTSFTTDWHRTGDQESEKWSGFARFNTPGGTFTYEVKNGLPTREADREVRNKNGCLSGPDCSTGDCYKTAKDACDSDGGCKLLCDALDVAGGQCTISIGAACFYLNAL